MKKALLLDTNFSAKPILDYLNSESIEVWVCGNNPNDALAKICRNYIELDYANVKEVINKIKELSIDYLIPGGNDFSYKICTLINREIPFYNIDSVEVNDIINNKKKFRLFAESIDIHVPKIISPADIKKNLPVIVKPADAYSGHGITIVRDIDDTYIKNAIKHAKRFSKSNSFLAEEFVEGQLYSHSAFINDGNIIIDFIAEEHCIANRYVVDTSRVVFNFNKNILKSIRADIEILARKLKLPDGLIHTQFIYNGNSFWLIEITRRCPGDLYSMLIEYSTGFPYAEFYTRPFINKLKHTIDFSLKKNYVLRHTITLSESKYLSSVVFKDIPKVFKYIPLSITGDLIEESPFSRIAVIFGNTSNEKKLSKLISKAITRNLYTVN